MKLVDFFDPSKTEHLLWFNYCQKYSDWSKEAKDVFIQNNVVFGNLFEEGLMVMAKIASYYMKQQLGSDFYCPDAFKEKL